MKKIFVTKILNEYEVILNVGADDGIEEKTTFAVYGITNTITDPITSDLLGEVPFIKENLQVKQLFPKLCICEAEGNGTFVQGTSFVDSLKFVTAGTRRLIHDKLNIDIDDLSKDEVDGSIRLGDKVEITSITKKAEETEDSNE